MENISDPLKWAEYELKLREFHLKKYFEATRLSADFSKLMVTNLIWINAAGLGALPVIANFIGISTIPWAGKFALLFCPGLLFAFGLIFGLLCALTAYFNYESIARHADHDCAVELHSVRIVQPAVIANPEYKALFENEREKSTILSKSARGRVQFTLIASHMVGWLSLLCFVGACYQLMSISPPLVR
ncbi:hypothetical protein [Methylocystis echinoides]|uniref:hypothetical protein n=1 Tax=Methylocystis echinoides TaxID=29468 RepID=UPI00341E85F9